MQLKPDDVRDYKVRKAADKGAGDAPPPSDQDAIIAAILRNVSPNYFRMRLALTVLGFALPVALLLVSGVRFDYSISTYYHCHSVARNILVGVLWTTGAFLLLYQGVSRTEDRFLNIAGIAAILTSLFPTSNASWCTAPVPAPIWIGQTHIVASIIFFACLAVVCVFLSRRTLSLIEDATVRRRFWLRYYAYGAMMILVPVAIGLLTLVFKISAHKYPIVWALEVTVIYVFAAFWWTKSSEFRAIATQLELAVPRGALKSAF